MAKKAEALMAHGMTARMYEELKLRKLSGDVETIKANRADSLTDEMFKKDFAGLMIPQHTRFHWHVAQEMRLFNQATGKRESTPVVHCYDAAMWKMVKDTEVFKAQISEIVHNPENEAKDAPLVTLKYTLTEAELAEQKEVEEEEDEVIDPKTLTLDQINAITDVAVAKIHMKALGGKPTKNTTLDQAKAAIIAALGL